MPLYPLTSYPLDMNNTTHDEMEQAITVDQPGIYRIKIQGRLNSENVHRFDEMAASVESNTAGYPVTTLTGQISDQAALHGIIARIRDLGLPLILVELVSPINQGG